jgi:hypothetical protein
MLEAFLPAHRTAIEPGPLAKETFEEVKEFGEISQQLPHL